MKMTAGKRILMIVLLLVVAGVAIPLPARAGENAPSNAVGEASQRMRDDAQNRSDALRDASRARGEAIREQSQRLRDNTRDRIEQQNREARERHQNNINRNRTPFGERGH